MNVAIILAGCGQHDGSETHEVILTLLSLAQEKIEWDAFAPDIKQHHVVNHLTGEPEADENREVLKESARLVRGKIKAITQVNINDYDAVIVPGGFGAVNNICDWSEKNNDFSFNSDVAQFLEQAVAHNKPIGFICIAPVMIPKLFKNAKLTIGNDEAIAKQIEETGASHINCSATEVVIDHENKVVSTPANMIANSIDEVYQGIHKLVCALKAMN